MTTSTPKPLKLFYCYARADKAYRDELDNHLSSLKRSHQIASWSDREISPGVEWETAIDKELNTAHIILLLVSASFMASDYAYGIEMKRAIERHKAGEARVVPILLRAVDWEDAPFSKLQILPSDAKPISRWSDHDDAFEDIAKGLRKVFKELQSLPTTAKGWLEKGNTLYGLRCYDEAILAYEQAIKLNPNYALAYYNKGTAIDDLERYDEAVLAYEQAIKLNPNYVAAYYNKGITLYDLQRYDEAILAYDQAITLDPNDAKVYYNKGNALLSLQRYDEAILAYNQAIMLDPSYAAAYLNKTNALYNLQCYDEAILTCDQVITLDPSYALAYNNKGVALRHLNRHSEADAAFKQAKELGYLG